MAARRSKVEVDQRFLEDNGGRRSGVDRRRFRYDLHIPERRSGEEQRIVNDRRNAPRYELQA